MTKILVTGAGGFIGGDLVKRLLEKNGPYSKPEIIATDIKPQNEWYQSFNNVTNIPGVDLKKDGFCEYVLLGNDCDTVYNLACDMGGIGYIEGNKAACMQSVLISTNMLIAAKEKKVKKFFYSSSACVYPDYLQKATENVGLKESDAYPAMAEDGYGWEKLFSERMARHFYEDYGLETRVARFHNIFGPQGAYKGGKEKAPAALCRKFAEAKITGNHEIEIWGDGEQTRSFLYIDDCLNGVDALVNSDCRNPLNIGSETIISINGLVSMLEDISGIKVKRVYNPNGPKGVRGRTSDNGLVRKELGWEPKLTLGQGMEKTFDWVYEQVLNDHKTLDKRRETDYNSLTVTF